MINHLRASWLTPCIYIRALSTGQAAPGEPKNCLMCFDFHTTEETFGASSDSSASNSFKMKDDLRHFNYYRKENK